MIFQYFTRYAMRSLIVLDHLRRGFARFKLCAHFLQARGERFNLLLLLRDVLQLCGIALVPARCDVLSETR